MRQQKTHRPLVTVYKLRCLLLSCPGLRQNPHAHKQSFDSGNNSFHGRRRQHHRQQNGYQQRIQCQPQQKERKIFLQIDPQRFLPEYQRRYADQHQHQLIDQRYRHQHHRGFRQAVVIPAHIIELHRLSARSRRRDARVEKPDEGIADAPAKTAAPVQRTQQIIDHDPLRTDKKQRHSHGRAQRKRRQPAQRVADLLHILSMKDRIEGQHHHEQEKSPLQDSFPVYGNPFYPIPANFHMPPPFPTLPSRMVLASFSPCLCPSTFRTQPPHLLPRLRRHP